eukprot:gb/GFBE01076275.1/.p1 GENE.gb/GFBE01076275.1/~~gb/GFBE01076275.1/.p1  ORF type:complete len:335 (+),score=69.93 gb/GFBE01076275.1/:1-1005(+)
MGSGASKKPSQRYSTREERERDNEDPDGGGKMGRRRSERHEFNEKIDCDWHEAHCKHDQFFLCRTIAEAYQFDENDKKVFSKKERVIGEGDIGNKKDWGKIKVSKNTPKKLNCDVCGKFIVERGGTGEFYVCRNCKDNGRKLELCKRCYDAGALSTPGAAEAVIKHEKKQREAAAAKRKSRTSLNLSQGSVDDFARQASKDRDSVIGRPGSKGRPTSKECPDPSNGSKEPVCKRPAVPSGDWTLTFVEGKSRRKEPRELQFNPNGSVTGRGPDCTCKGFFANGAAGDDVDIVETYPWGTITINVKVDKMGFTKMTGKFIASDDGKGTIELSFDG